MTELKRLRSLLAVSCLSVASVNAGTQPAGNGDNLGARTGSDPERAAVQDDLDKRLRSEEDARNSQIVGAAQQAWVTQLSSVIRRHWTRRAGPPDTLRRQAQIELSPDGAVRNVRVLNRSGVPAFDDSVVSAIEKSSPLPLPSDPRAFNPDLRPWFDPRQLSNSIRPTK